MPVLPLKDYCYIAAIVVLLIAFGTFVHHERTVGAAAVIARDTIAEAAQKERNDALQTTAALATSIANGDYTREISVPVHDASVPVGLCNNPARYSGGLPGTPADRQPAASSAVRDADAGAAAEIQRLTDFANGALTIARDADAALVKVETENQILRTEMEKARAPSK